LEANVARLEGKVQAKDAEINSMKGEVAEAQARMEKCI